MCGYCSAPSDREPDDIFETLDEELAHRDTQLLRLTLDPDIIVRQHIVNINKETHA